jgi:hypothetical protein
MQSVKLIRNSALIFVILLSMSLWVHQLSSFEEDINLEAPSIVGFEEIQRGVFKAAKAKDNFHLLKIPLLLVSDAYYRIQYDVNQLPREKIIVRTDFYAPRYDNPEQELTKVFGMNVLGKHQDYIVNLGQSPLQGLFRLFYSGSPGLEVANIKITQIATGWVWFKRLLFASTLGGFFILALVVIQKYRNYSALPKSIENSQSIIVAAEFPAVLSVYFCFVLIRYIMYIMMPYSSGDEYIYKSLAAGIWQFGHHGVLTDTMFSYSVNFPNLLYPYLIAPAFLLEENFYFGVRLINAIVMNMAIFPCYLIARKFLDRNSALASALLSLAIPFINIGAFSATEVLFFPFFLLSIWLAIESIERPRSIGWAISFGLVAGILLNVRLNAMILLPAYLFSLLWISLRQQKAVNLLTRPYWLIVVVAFLFSYIGLKYSLDSKAIGDFGFYAGLADRGEGPLSIIVNNPVGILHLIAGHLTTLAIPYALPITLMISTLASSKRKWDGDRKFYDFVVIAIIFSAALFALALVFTISVSPFDLGGLGRWHSRYYFYFYPLVIIAGVVFTTHLQPLVAYQRFWALIIVTLLLATNIYFIKFHHATLIPWFGSMVDNMDVQWYRLADKFYWPFVILTILISWLWYIRSRFFQSVAAFFVVAWVIVANYGTLQYAGVGSGVRQASVELSQATDITLSAPCGAFAFNFLDHYPGRFIVVGDSRSTMVAAAFWNPYVPEKTLIYDNSAKLLGSAEVGTTADYLIVNGTVLVDSAYRSLISIGKCTIYEIQN